MADENLVELTENTSPTADDLLYQVDDPVGTPVDRKVTIENVSRVPVDHRDFDEAASVANPASGDLRIYAGTDSKLYSRDDAGVVLAIGEGVLAHKVCMRLSPTTGDPVELDEVADATVVYWTPFKGNAVRMYDGTRWKFLVGTEKSFKLTDDSQTGDTSNGGPVIDDLTDTSMLVVGMEVTGTGIGASAVIASIDSATQVTVDINSTADGNDVAITFKCPANAKYDLFAEIDTGAPDLRRPVAWTNPTTRATALTEQDDVKVLTGDTDSIYLGYVVVSATAGEFDFTITANNLFNFYHTKPLDYGVWESAELPITALRPSDSGGCAAISELDNNATRAFDPDTDEQALINLDFPAGWSGKLKAVVKWAVNDGDAGNVIWAIKTENAATGEVMGNASTTTLTANAAGGTQFEFSATAISAEHTAGADGENILFFLIRDADNVADTYASDAYAVSVMLYYLMYEDGIS